MDTGWSDIQKTFARPSLEMFARDSPRTLPIAWWSSMAAGSLAVIVLTPALAPKPSHDGPCVLQEYRGRGLGTALLRASLGELREAGFARAYGVARDKTAAARFVYPKFGGLGGRWSPDFEVAQKLAA